MIHFLPESEPVCAPYAEAVARLAGLRHALNVVAPSGGASAGPSDSELALGWANSSAAHKRAFDRQSERLTASAAAGLEAMLAAGEVGPAARARMAEEIRAGLDELSRVLGAPPRLAREA